MQIQISKIQNGWLVMLPPPQSHIIQASQMGIQAQPTIMYCKDWETVLEFMKNDPSEQGSVGSGPTILR